MGLDNNTQTKPEGKVFQVSGKDGVVRYVGVMRCPYCGTELPETAYQCYNCKKKLGKSSSGIKLPKIAVVVLAGLVVVAGIGSFLGGNDEPVQVPDPAPIVQPVDPAPVPEPEPEPVVDETPVSAEPEPEPEPEPAPTVEKFETVTYSGTGDDVIEIETPKNRAWVMEVKGNSSSNHFSITGYDSNMEYVDLFVNTTSPYEGFVVDERLVTTVLEITAESAWEIKIHDLFNTVPEVKKGDTISGHGDAVYQIESYGVTADVVGNSDSHHFAVKTLGDEMNELLVNTTEPYTGTVMLKGKPFLLIITSESDWEIKF